MDIYPLTSRAISLVKGLPRGRFRVYVTGMNDKLPRLDLKAHVALYNLENDLGLTDEQTTEVGKLWSCQDWRFAEVRVTLPCGGVMVVTDPLTHEYEGI